MNPNATNNCAKCGAFERNKRGECLHCKKIRDAEYQLAHKEQISQKSSANYQKNKAARLERAAEYRKTNKEKIKESRALFYEKNKARVNAACKDYYERNSEKVQKKVSEYRAKHPEKIAELKAKWIEANLEQINLYSRNRRALKRNAGGKLSKDIVAKLLRLQRGLCACCKQPLGPNYHVDHIMPLVLGGSNTDSNVQLLRAKCNQRKNKAHPIDYMRSKGYLL